MAKKKKVELEDDLNLLVMMWDEGTFASVIKNGNQEVAQFADIYWDNTVACDQKDPLTKVMLFKELAKMPELSAEDRCRVALNTVIRLRDGGLSPCRHAAGHRTADGSSVEGGRRPEASRGM